MRVARVYTNETCNQLCRFCDRRRPDEDRAFIAPSAVRARVSRAIADGATELILTGGEPTMRRDLADLVAFARESGAERVSLETNGALLDDDKVESLRSAGLTLARVHLPAFGETLDSITQDPGGWTRTYQALVLLSAARIPIEISVPVIRGNRGLLADLIHGLANDSAVDFVSVVIAVPNSGPDDDELLPLGQAARAIEELEAAARGNGVTLRMEADALIPPCLFSRPHRVAHLYSLTPGGRERPGWSQMHECEICVAQDRCPGFADASRQREPDLRAVPITDDLVRRKLSQISTIEDQVARELYQEDFYLRDGGVRVPSRIVRINFLCNQACRFCFVSTHLPTASDEAVEGAIRGIANEGGVVVLSGGEPTLNPRLLDYVRFAKAEGASQVELQTNAIKLGDLDFCRQLIDAGVDQLFISLHGSKPDISDRVTEAPGTFDKTVRGIDRALELGLGTRLNFVFCETNYRDFPDYVRFVSARWPAAELVVSFVAGSTDVVPKTADLIPNYSDVLGYLSLGMGIAQETGTRVLGFESMCGIPLCLVPADLEDYFRLAEVPEDFDRGEFVKTKACERCDLFGKCFGVRRGYVELHGESEFSPVSAVSN